MKRVNHLYEKLISDANLEKSIREVNASHRWLPRHRPNRTVAWVEDDIPARVKELRAYIEGLIAGTEQLHEPLKKHRYDRSAGKWRDINEPLLWPDQYVHHALVQVLEPVMMRGMDRYCCGSIRGRGIHYGVKAIQKWMKDDPKGTKYAGEFDIYHFYDSIGPETVIDRIRQLVKDWRILRLCELVLAWGVLIGLYTSQWFANVLLQPLDRLIRESGLCAHYIRYMDNFTVFGPNKRKLRRLRLLIAQWLDKIGLRLKGNWQIYPTKARTPTALGYRFGHGFTLLRKRNLLRLKRSLARYRRRKRRGRRISRKLAVGLLSRLGQLRHCNRVGLYRGLEIAGVQRELKNIVRAYARKETLSWNTLSGQTATRRSCGPRETPIPA